MNSEKRCLVIGANGFIGSHLVDELVGSGFLVRAFDRFTEPAQYTSHENIETVKGDFFNEKDIVESLKDVDFVFHSLSMTTPYSSDNDPFTDIDRNLRPTVQLFDLCLKSGVKKVIYMSSGGAIYGHISEERAASEDNATTPVSPYGIIKLAIENYLAYFNRKFGLDYTVYRLTNPYGPRQQFRNNQGVIPAFLQQIKEKQEVIVLGDGEASRDYVYIRDVTRMITESFYKDTKYRTYNVGSGKQTTVNQIIDAIRNATHLDFSVTNIEPPKTFLKSANISTARFQDEFGDHATTSLEEGLKATTTGY